jgi:hypothetical protein
VAKGNARRPRDAAASDSSLPLFPPEAADKPVSRRKEQAAAPNVVAMPRKAGPTPEDLARRAMAHQPTGASGKKLKLTLTIFLSREQAEKLTARAPGSAWIVSSIASSSSGSTTARHRSRTLNSTA